MPVQDQNFQFGKSLVNQLLFISIEGDAYGKVSPLDEWRRWGLGLSYM